MKPCCLIHLTLLGLTFSAPAADAPKPNVIVILCDDLGWGDIENHGHPHIKTPNLMKMAAEGIQFSSFYSASPVCSPSRVGLLTGRNPNRAGVYDWIPEAKRKSPGGRSRSLVEMRDSEFTIPAMLKSVGYATCMVGKWHCNAKFNSPDQAQPDDHGFDHWFATQNNAAPSHENPTNFVRNGEEVGPLAGYSCELVADEAIAWLSDHHNRSPDDPFFIYLAFHEPHEPVASPPDLVQKYLDAGASNADEAQYFANVENLDAATGKLIAAVDEMGYRDDTLIIFTSDNGPETLNRYRSANRSYGSPGPWRGMKLHTYEAGYRVAGIMRYPDRIAAGQQSDAVVSSLDFLPTFASLAGAELPDDLLLDGANFLPALSGGEIPRSRPLLWVYYNALNGAPVSMRDGDMKIIGAFEPGSFRRTSQIDLGNIEALNSAELTEFEIYDLAADPDESDSIDTGKHLELKERFVKQYRKALETFHVWPKLTQ